VGRLGAVGQAGMHLGLVGCKVALPHGFQRFAFHPAISQAAQATQHAAQFKPLARHERHFVAMIAVGAVEILQLATIGRAFGLVAEIESLVAVVAGDDRLFLFWHGSILARRGWPVYG